MLDGALNVSLLNGYTPAVPDIFPILTFVSHSNDFATKSGLLLGNGLAFSPIFTPTNLNLEVSPTHLAFVQQPTTTIAGQITAPAVTVAIEDASNNVLTFDNSDSVTLTIDSGPSGGTLFGTTNATVVNGIASFGEGNREFEHHRCWHALRGGEATKRRHALARRRMCSAQHAVERQVHFDVLAVCGRPLLENGTRLAVVRCLQQREAEISMERRNGRPSTSNALPLLDCRLRQPAREIE